MSSKKLGDKNKETVEMIWAEYQKHRRHLIDCFADEGKNCYGNHWGTVTWECKGARFFEEYFRAPGAAKDSIPIGWCKGPDACPLVGPLDTFNSSGVKLNPVSYDKRDLRKWK